MSKDAFVTKILGPKKDIILVRIRPQKAPKNLVAKLDKFFSILLNKGHRKWVFDLSEVPFPSSSMIAFFISATHLARQAGGEVKIIHLSTSASNNLLSFNPLSFMSVEESEDSALQAFGVETAEDEQAEPYEPEPPEPPKEVHAQRKPSAKKGDGARASEPPP
ncbi:MAG: anti-sigma factor antagonist, partial [Caldilineae bacterium]